MNIITVFARLPVGTFALYLPLTDWHGRASCARVHEWRCHAPATGGGAMPERARAEWSANMSNLALDCAGSCAEDVRKRLRTIWHLLTIAPQTALLQGM